jgi:hypothetical protein
MVLFPLVLIKLVNEISIGYKYGILVALAKLEE